MEYNNAVHQAINDMNHEEIKQMIINVVLTSLESNFDRTKKIRDPVTRHILFLEKLLSFKDVMMASLETIPMSKESKIRSEKLCAIINGEVESLIDWIQQPIYSPDHAFGNSMMKEAEKDFNTKK